MNDATNRAPEAATATRMLEVAERLAQTRGFNGFSYADIAAELGITKASLHYHFASKAELGRALLLRYTRNFDESLAAIAGDSAHRLGRYVQLYEQVLVRDRMCLCGMLAAEYSTLPAEMQAELRHFFDKNEEWLAGLLNGGRATGDLTFEGSALEVARVLTAGLEGAMLLARSYEEPARFTVIANRLIAELRGSRAASAGKNGAKRTARPAAAARRSTGKRKSSN